MKLKYLTAALATLRMSGKLTDAAWLVSLTRDGRRSGYVVEAFLEYWPSWYVLSSSP